MTGSSEHSPAPVTNDDGEPRSRNYFESLSETADENGGSIQERHPTTQSMTRSDKGKFKKLRKRAIKMLTESERSGLLTRSEYEEYIHYCTLAAEDTKQRQAESNDDRPVQALVLPLARPSVNVRKKCIGIEKAEGATHRDLLSWLLHQKFHQHGSSSKKRKRGGGGADTGEEKQKKIVTNPINLPHWVSVHNPGSCEQVAVLEVHVPYDGIDPYCDFLRSCNSGSKASSDKESLDQDKASIMLPTSTSNSQVGMVTKWFQGHMPKSMSESLLYFSNAKKPKKTKGSENGAEIPSKEGFIERLETMLLSPKDMNDQGYPQPLPMNSEDNSIPNFNEEIGQNDVGEKPKSPDSIPQDTANAFVHSFGVRVEDQNEDDKCAYVETPKPLGETTVKRPARVIGLDCEMVMTTLGSELARVTLLRFDEFVGATTTSKTTLLMDCIVRPKNSITDYLTKHSGITPALMDPVATTLEQVQYALASFLTPNDILVGHSLENDLRALHYIHPRVVDTSMIFRPEDKSKRFKFSLRHLSNVLLKKQIQTGSHCSEEDAQTTLDLALLKALKGDDLHVPGFGNNQRQSLLSQPFVQEGVAAFVGPNSWLETHVTKYPNGAHALAYDSPNDCKKAMLAWMNNKRKAHLVWSKIDLGTKPDDDSGSTRENPVEVFKSLVTELVQKMPTQCVLLVAIQGELQKARDIFKRRGACRDPRSTLIWSEDDETEWNEVLSSTRKGYVHWFSAPEHKK